MINYAEIGDAIADIIARDDDVLGVDGMKIAVEVGPEYHEGPYVLVQLDRRDAPANIQSASGGARTRYLIRYVVTVFTESLGEIRQAILRRDDLLSRVERALMRYRQSGDRIAGTHHYHFEGGSFDAARGDAGFNAAAEIVVIVDATTSV